MSYYSSIEGDWSYLCSVCCRTMRLGWPGRALLALRSPASPHLSALRTFSDWRMTVSAPDLVSFVHAAPTPFHLVTEAATRLEGAGFTRLQETELWAAGKLVVPGGRYFYHRNMSTIGNPTLTK